MPFGFRRTMRVVSARGTTGGAPRVGIPRALLAYRYYVLWHRFLAELGCDVVVSPPTNQAILSAGIRATIDDLCIPVKAYVGHLLHLKSRGVDALFVPRVIAVERARRRRFTCPKLMGLPDLARALVDGTPALVDADLDVAARPEADTYVEIGRMLGSRRKVALAAYRTATDDQARFDRARADGRSFDQAVAAALGRRLDEGHARRHPDETAGRAPGCGLYGDESGQPVIATVGHPYLLGDRLLSFSLHDRLARLGVRLFDPMSLPTEALESELVRYGEISWSYEREMLGAVSHLLRRPGIDGLVFLTSFACGTFPVISEIIEREARRGTTRPLLYLMVDELTGEAGVQTRIESFCDLIRDQRERVGADRVRGRVETVGARGGNGTANRAIGPADGPAGPAGTRAAAGWADDAPCGCGGAGA